MSYIQCCPACQSTDQEVLFDMGSQPMSLVALQRDPLQSASLERHRIRLAICRNCGHVHNIDFNPNHVSYAAAGCRMYNSGSGWQRHVEVTVKQVEEIEDVELIIEVGAGDCEFLNRINTDAIKIAIDPCEAVERAEELGIQYYREHFDPKQHIPLDGGKLVIIMRHLLEHMENPREFIEPIVRMAEKRAQDTILLIEVPCCQEALKKCRIEDWTYEHPQHFTVLSMMKLFRACGIEFSHAATTYGGEVIVAMAKLEPKRTKGLTVDQILFKYKRAQAKIDEVRSWLVNTTDRVALWGGGGKSAMFINKFKLPDTTLVVDSHEEKWGFCVPGTKIPMVSPTALKKFPVDYIICTTSWRSLDIRDEIIKLGIECKGLLKFEFGKLVEVPLGKNEEA